MRCDVTSWEDQVAMFKAAVANSPEKSCDIVVANAGIGGEDSIFKFDGMSTFLLCPNHKTAFFIYMYRNRRTNQTRPKNTRNQRDRSHIHDQARIPLLQ